MNILLVNTKTSTIIDIKSVSDDFLLEELLQDPSEENYYVTDKDYKIGDVYKFD
jgi:hypothetical protein